MNRRRLLNPLNFAALLTIGAIAPSMRFYEGEHRVLAWSLLAAFLLGFLSLSVWPPRWRRIEDGVIALLAVIAGG